MLSRDSELCNLTSSSTASMPMTSVWRLTLIAIGFMRMSISSRGDIGGCEGERSIAESNALPSAAPPRPKRMMMRVYAIPLTGAAYQHNRQLCQVISSNRGRTQFNVVKEANEWLK